MESQEKQQRKEEEIHIGNAKSMLTVMEMFYSSTSIAFQARLLGLLQSEWLPCKGQRDNQSLFHPI